MACLSDAYRQTEGRIWSLNFTRESITAAGIIPEPNAIVRAFRTDDSVTLYPKLLSAPAVGIAHMAVLQFDRIHRFAILPEICN